MMATKIRHAMKEGLQLGIINTQDTLMVSGQSCSKVTSRLLTEFSVAHFQLGQHYRKAKRALSSRWGRCQL